jgi:hypothetical protein
MHNKASFIAITDEAYLKAPKALQEFVKKYFKEENIFGTKCWVAFQTLSIRGSREEKGVAPSHSSDINYFGEQVNKSGLNGRFLADVIDKLEKSPTKCFNFYRSWDDGCSGHMHDD